MKKILVLILALVLCLSFAACTAEEAAPEESTPSESAPVEESANPGLQKLIVGASPSPHAEILRQVVEDLAAQGIDLEIVEFLLGRAGH